MGNLARFVFLFLVMFYFLPSVYAEGVYVLEFNQQSGDFSLLRIYLSPGYTPDRVIQPGYGYRCELVSFYGDILYSFNFSLSDILMPPLPLEGENYSKPVKITNLNQTILIPYYSEGKTVKIYNPSGSLVLEADVSQFSPRRYEQTQSGTPVEETGSGEKTGSQDSYSFLLFLAVAAVFLLVLVIYFRKRRLKSEAPSDSSGVTLS